MSNAEGEKPDFDDLDLPTEDPERSDEETSDFVAPDDETVEPAEETLEPAEGAGLAGLGTAAIGAGAEAEEEPEEEPEEEEKEKKPGLLSRLTTANPYVVLLGIALAALLISILYLIMEWRRYGLQTKPPQAGMTPAVPSDPPASRWA